MSYEAPIRLVIAPSHMFHVCGGDELSTGCGALQHEWVEVVRSRIQGGVEARGARTEDNY